LENDWSSVDPANTAMTTTIAFRNNQDDEIRLTRIDYEVRINGLLLDRGSKEESIVVQPGEEATVDVTPRFPSSWVYGWFRSHIENGESSTLRTTGNAFFTSSSGNFDSPFEAEDTWTTHVLRDLSTDMRNCPSTPPEPCVESVEQYWDTSAPGVVRVRSVLNVMNPGDSPLHVANRSASLIFGNVTIGSAETAERLTLPPGATTPVSFTVEVGEAGLNMWWPTHANACEASPVSFDVKLGFEEQTVQPPPPSTTSPQPTNGTDQNTTTHSTDPPYRGSADVPPPTALGPEAQQTEPNGTTNGTDPNQTVPPAMAGITWSFQGSAFESHFVCGRSTGVKVPGPIPSTVATAAAVALWWPRAFLRS
jgi:LEA14-like dessication related protein